MALEQHYTVAQVAKLLSISTDTVLKLCRQGHLSATKPTRDWCIPESGVQHYLDEKRRTPPERPRRPYAVPKTTGRAAKNQGFERLTMAVFDKKETEKCPI